MDNALMYISLGLMALLIFQQVYLTMTINRLVNKVMSRNYGEYKQVENHKPQPTVFKFETETEPTQDLSELEGITL